MLDALCGRILLRSKLGVSAVRVSRFDQGNAKVAMLRRRLAVI
jgi:hypothetical protein